MGKSPIFGISRLRMGTDGHGITTLVCFMGCPLDCKYCLNQRCHEPKHKVKGVLMLSPQELYDMVKVDNLYFQTTGGGITFGGGEPTLHEDFIKEFREICGDKWKINIETSVYCSTDTIKNLSKVVDKWFVDIKSLDAEIYEAYTGRPSRIIEMLRFMVTLIPTEKIVIRVPGIPGYTDNVDFEKDIEFLNRLGFNDIDRFQYIIK